jgi:DnaJ-domain-containing protein 1
MGPRQTINNAIFLLLFWLALTLFWHLLPVLVIIYFATLVLGNKNRRTNSGRRTRTYYYKFGDEDFNNFFKNTGGNYGDRSYSQGSFGSTPYFEDKSKYYSVLGVSQTASQEEIKKAFRNKAREFHPDKYAGKSESERVEAEKKFKEINEAYDKLKK